MECASELLTDFLAPHVDKFMHQMLWHAERRLLRSRSCKFLAVFFASHQCLYCSTGCLPRGHFKSKMFSRLWIFSFCLLERVFSFNKKCLWYFVLRVKWTKWFFPDCLFILLNMSIFTLCSNWHGTFVPVAKDPHAENSFMNHQKLEIHSVLAFDVQFCMLCVCVCVCLCVCVCVCVLGVFLFWRKKKSTLHKVWRNGCNIYMRASSDIFVSPVNFFSQNRPQCLARASNRAPHVYGVLKSAL